MTCVGNTTISVDSEMEEGEIVDDLSDISSEEEYLLREHLAVLENYNKVLGRKNAKCSPVAPGKTYKNDDVSYDLSTATEFNNYCSSYKKTKSATNLKSQKRENKKKQNTTSSHQKSRDRKKKNSNLRKRLSVQVLMESSEESEDDYKNDRQKLADAVVVNSKKNDKSSLSERLQKMFCGVNLEPTKIVIKENKRDTHSIINEIDNTPLKPPQTLKNDENVFDLVKQNADHKLKNLCEIADTDESNKTTVSLTLVDTIDSVHKTQTETQIIRQSTINLNNDSDDDLELLRQHALKTKVVNNKKVENHIEITLDKNVSEDEDSDTKELRLICLKSAILKKAIETKQKKRLQKKRSQSSNIHDESLEEIVMADIMNSNNNTDRESVDMDIGSDIDDKAKENCEEYAKNSSNEYGKNITDRHIPVLMVTQVDELEEDEDLLRAKLLTSLSKNLPNLITPKIDDTSDIVSDTKHAGDQPRLASRVPEEKRFIISLESDSEGENEATMNLTKMHMKLSDQKDFQQKLDMFLKSTRMEVEENTTLPDVVQQPDLPPAKKPEKCVVKEVKNLPKEVQMEYKNLVKRMAELEKIKMARQSTMNTARDTLKPKISNNVNNTNSSVIVNLDEKIQKSRKNIAEESAKMLRLKQEGVKLSQKFKIVATELRNLKTAIALNNRQQRSVQNYLTQIRQHHQTLLKSSLNTAHSKVNIAPHLNNNDARFQKENNLRENVNNSLRVTKDNTKNSVIQKTVKINVTNDVKQTNSNKTKPQKLVQHPRLSVELDVTNNTKCVTLVNKDEENNTNHNDNSKSSVDCNPAVEKGGGSPSRSNAYNKRKRKNSDDYKSPLDAFGSNTWSGDPNAILCPFDVCGDCKDADCKYQHTNTPSK